MNEKSITTAKRNAIPVRADAAPQDHEQLHELQGQEETLQSLSGWDQTIQVDIWLEITTEYKYI